MNETVFKELKVSLQTYKQHTGIRQNCISCKYILNFNLSGRFGLILTEYWRITILLASKLFCVTRDNEYTRCLSDTGSAPT